MVREGKWASEVLKSWLVKASDFTLRTDVNPDVIDRLQNENLTR